MPGAAGEGAERLKEIAINDVAPSPRQPRQLLNGEKLTELADSIKEHGIVQPIVVRPLEGGKFQIIAGERRWRACLDLGMQKIPAVIRDYGDLEAAAVALIENVQRENLNPVEEARAYRILMEEFGLTQEEVSKRVGKSRPFVGNMVRLLTLPDEIQRMVLENRITTGHARAILGIQDGKRQIAAANKIIKGQMNVRQAENLVRTMAVERKRVAAGSGKTGEYSSLEKDLKEKIPAARVRVREINEGGGRVIIDFKSPAEMVSFIESFKEGKGTTSV